MVDSAKEGWGTEPDPHEYSLERVYKAAADRRGHSQPIQARMDTEIVGSLAELIASRLIPDYGTVSDFIRDAIYHRLHYWQEKIAQGWSPRLSAAMALMEIDARHNTLMSHRKVIDDANTLLTRAVQEADLDMLGDAISFTRLAGQEFGQPWKERLDQIAAQAEDHERRLRNLRKL